MPLLPACISRWHSLTQPDSLCRMPQVPPQCQKLCCHHCLWRRRNRMLASWQWLSHLYFIWFTLMHGLAMTSWLHKYRPPRMPSLLRLQKTRSWCTGVSSSTENLMHLLLTIMRPGLLPCSVITSMNNTLTFPKAFRKVSVLAYAESFVHMFRLMARQWRNMQIYIRRLKTKNLERVGTSVLFPSVRLKASLVLSNPHLYLLCLSPVNSCHFALYIIFPLHILPYLQFHPLIHQSTLMIFHAPGVPLTQWPLSSPTYHQGHRHQFVMWLRHIIWYPSFRVSGQAWSFNCKVLIGLPSIPVIILAFLWQVMFMATLLMQVLISFGLKELAPFQNGLMTTFSFVFPKKNYLITINCIRTNIVASLRTVATIAKAVEYGIVVARWLMTVSKNSMRIIAGLSRTYRPFHHLIVYILTVMLILTMSLIISASLGKVQKQFPLGLLFHIWVLDGILMRKLSPYLSTKKKSISSASLSGANGILTPSSKFKVYMEIFFTPAWL